MKKTRLLSSSLPKQGPTATGREVTSNDPPAVTIAKACDYGCRLARALVAWPGRQPGMGVLRIHIEKAPVETGAFCVIALTREPYLSPRFLSAVPRISPSVAPESEEP